MKMSVKEAVARGQGVREGGRSVENGNGLGAKLSKHFGRALHSIVVDLDESNNILGVETASNTGASLRHRWACRQCTEA